LIKLISDSFFIAVLCITGKFCACPYGTNPYTVQPGDTFYTIASRYGTTIEAISSANPLVDSRSLVIGQLLCIPTTGYNTYNTGSNPTGYNTYNTGSNPTGYNTYNTGSNPTGYNTNYNTNTAYASNTYYGVNQYGQYNSYYNTGCNNYVVRAGDTCSSLAGVSSNYFYQQNSGINCNSLQVGQSICLPYGSNYGTMTGYYSGCNNYQVRSSDTCATMAAQTGVSIYEFYNLNGYLNCNNLQVGQSVCMPWGNAGTNMIGYSTGNRCYGRQNTIQYGDNCWSMAQRFGTTVEQLQACTGLDCKNLQVGQIVSF